MEVTRVAAVVAIAGTVAMYVKIHLEIFKFLADQGHSNSSRLAATATPGAAAEETVGTVVMCVWLLNAEGIL